MYHIYEKARDALELKDADVAKATGIPQSTFSDWKNGISEPGAEKKKAIANVLGIDMVQLVGDYQKRSE